MELKSIFKYSLIILLVACAQKSTISGGPRDTEGPKMLASKPVSATTNFSQNSIELSFDEYLQIKAFKNNVVVSPPLNTIDYNLKGRKLEILWEDTLVENTTYSFFFGDAIVDLNEANPLKENQFVFSTGDIIDSLQLSGKVINAEDRKAGSEVFVFLYQSDYDSCVYNEIPRYITKTDKNGAFTFKYLSEGSYRLVALEDKNNNYQYDELDEQIAFESDLVYITDSIAPRELFSFLQKDTINKIVSKKLLYSELYTAYFKYPVQDFEIVYLGQSAKKKPEVYEEWSANRDSLKLWLNDFSSLDSLEMIFNERYFNDTIMIYPNAKKTIKEEKNLWGNKHTKKFLPKDTLVLLFSHSIISYDTSTWVLIKDSVEVPFNFEKVENKRLFITGLTEGKHELMIPDSNLVNVVGMSNPDTLRFSFQAVSPLTYGNLDFKIRNIEMKSSFVQILTSKGAVVHQEAFSDSTHIVSLKSMKPGKYKAKVTRDLNRNNQWDSGNYLKNQQAEEVILFKEEIQIRANWDLELEWNLKPE